MDWTVFDKTTTKIPYVYCLLDLIRAGIYWIEKSSKQFRTTCGLAWADVASCEIWNAEILSTDYECLTPFKRSYQSHNRLTPFHMSMCRHLLIPPMHWSKETIWLKTHFPDAKYNSIIPALSIFAGVQKGLPFKFNLWICFCKSVCFKSNIGCWWILQNGFA